MARVLLLALLLALSLPMGAAAVPSGGTATVAATPSLQDTAILTLNDSSRASFTTASVDVSTAMAVQREGAASRLDQYTLDERLENTESTEAKRTMLLESATDVEIRIVSLRSDSRTLRAAYEEGDIDTETFLARMAHLHARASELRTTLDRIRTHAAGVSQFSLNGRTRLLDSRLIGYHGPVRERALSTSVGEAPATRIFVTASADGVVLSMLDGGRYVREAYRADQRTPDTVSSFTIDEAETRANFELYPTAYNESGEVGFGQTIDGAIGGNIYLVQYSMPTGSLSAYLDDGTRNVFFEVQERRVDLLAPRPTVVGTDNGTRLTVNRSYPGGPLRLSVVDDASGAPLQTTVIVAGHPVETGPDGTAWTLAPSGSFQVTAVGPGGNVTVTVRPLTPTSVTGEG